MIPPHFKQKTITLRQKKNSPFSASILPKSEHIIALKFSRILVLFWSILFFDD